MIEHGHREPGIPDSWCRGEGVPVAIGRHSRHHHTGRQGAAGSLHHRFYHNFNEEKHDRKDMEEANSRGRT